MRKLTVKNFSVIKEAELEFGKITVLIGPQSSGKSLLCKLAYFFEQVIFEQAEIALRASDTPTNLKLRVYSEFLRWFSNFERGNEMTDISYSDAQFRVRITQRRVSKLETRFDWEFSFAFDRCYKAVRRRLRDAVAAGAVDPKVYAVELRDCLLGLRSPGTPDVYSYVPSTRSFFVTLQRAVLASASRTDEISTRFSQSFEYGFEASVPKSGREHTLTKWIDSESNSLLKGMIIPDGQGFRFLTNDGRNLSLASLSSGAQELLPLLTCLREFVSVSAAVARTLESNSPVHRRLFFVEEPEANIFPSSQYELIRVFSRMANEPELDSTWVITTHSPYILSSFNNLLEAWQAGHMDKERSKAVCEVIDEKYWVNPDEFRAYSINDGYLKSIVDEETHLISDNFLDSVSERIGGEFDELLRIGYVEA